MISMGDILRMFWCEVPLCTLYPRWVVLPVATQYPGWVRQSRMGEAVSRMGQGLCLSPSMEISMQRSAALTSSRRGARGTLPTTTVYEQELKAMNAKLTKPPAGQYMLAGRRNQPSRRSGDRPTSRLTKTSPPSQLQRYKQFVLRSNSEDLYTQN